MGTRKYEERNRRAIQKSATGSYYVTIPKHLVRELRWQVRQDLDFEISGKKLVIKDAK